MKAMEGVRRVTNRMELIQGLKSKLLKARLSLIAVTILLGVSAVTNVVMYNKLQDSKEVVAKQEVQITELENTIEVVETEREELAIKLDIANSFETLMDKVANLEDLALEAIHNAQKVVEDKITYVNKYNKVRTTDISYVDYVLDETTGETVRTFETNEEMYVVYLSNSENIELLNNNLVKQYRSGLNNYEEAIKEVEDTVIIRHDLK
ncbi:MAG: hypothetical protein J6D47_09325 [Peptostreptococcaceae bacterium]|nr:hypothetical protein [Peptostreptococcaceae bacterium]